MVERPDDMIALEEYKLLPSEEVERWEALYQLVEVLVSSPHPSEIRSMLEQ